MPTSTYTCAPCCGGTVDACGCTGGSGIPTSLVLTINETLPGGACPTVDGKTVTLVYNGVDSWDYSGPVCGGDLWFFSLYCSGTTVGDFKLYISNDCGLVLAGHGPNPTPTCTSMVFEINYITNSCACCSSSSSTRQTYTITA